MEGVFKEVEIAVRIEGRYEVEVSIEVNVPKRLKDSAELKHGKKL